MNFLIEDEIDVKDGRVSISLSNEFNNYFDITELVHFGNIEGLDLFFDIDIKIEDLVIVTVYSTKTGTEKLFATTKDYLERFLQKWIKVFEKHEEYEICGLIQKLIEKYKILKDEK